MEMIKKNLKTVKNKLLCELEDYLMDAFMPSMSNEGIDKEAMGKELMANVMNAIKTNAVRFTVICYTDKDGKELEEADLQEMPLKIKLFKECLPDIMEIMGDYLTEGEEEPGGKQKVKVIPKR